jgi:hypothetical protein
MKISVVVVVVVVVLWKRFNILVRAFIPDNISISGSL